MSNIQKDFVNRVKSLMEARNITAYKLSKESGISQAALSKMFSGSMNPSLEIIDSLAKGLNVEIVDLFTFDEESGEIPPNILKVLKNQDKSFYDAVEFMAKAASPKKR